LTKKISSPVGVIIFLLLLHKQEHQVYGLASCVLKQFQ